MLLCVFSSTWPSFLQKNLKQLKRYHSHMIYEVNEPSLRALMKTHDPGARREGTPAGGHLLLLSPQPEGSPQAVPVPCHPQSHVTLMWTTSEDSAVSQPAVRTHTCFPGGVGCTGGRGTRSLETEECLGE